MHDLGLTSGVQNWEGLLWQISFTGGGEQCKQRWQNWELASCWQQGLLSGICRVFAIQLAAAAQSNLMETCLTAAGWPEWLRLADGRNLTLKSQNPLAT